MSQPGSPSSTRDAVDSINPALHPSNTSIPVTPGVHLGGGSSYIEPEPEKQDKLPFDPDKVSPGPQWNANSYFAPRTTDTEKAADQAKGLTSEELVQRLKEEPDASQKSDIADVDPRTAHPNLHLSGHIISATFIVPYNLGYAPGNDWELHFRRGTSALFDSFSYLASSSSPWNHTLVGWTGELRELPQARNRNTSETAALNSVTPLNKSSAPIPVNPNQPHLPQAEGLRIGPEDRARLEKQLERDHGGRIVPVWLTDSYDEEHDTIVIKDQSRWRAYAERELYTLFHYKPSEPTDARAARKAWADYYRMNTLFADRIVKIYNPGDIIFIHDYYLLLLPSLIRQRLPNAYICFFLHSPFPSSELYRCLSRRKELLEGMLGANMVGFQSYSYSRHFSSCCSRILGFDSSSAGVDAYGAHVAVDVFPIGINAAATHKQAFGDPSIDEKIKGIRELYAGKKIIVGRDRLDAVRGVAQKLQAFEFFLERYPEWQDKVVLIQVTSPSYIREDQAQDDDNKFMNKISDLVSSINGTFGSLSFTPVQHYPQYLSREEYFALLRVADVGLITSVRDGMNTTGLEYIIAQRDNHGPLILSEFSGTAGSLGSAIHINPWDFGGVSDAINRALTMSNEEMATQHDKLYRHVITNNVQAWSNNVIKRFLTNLSSFNQSFATPALDRAKLLQTYRNAKRRLFMFDYDGTLTPIVKDPQSAIPSDRVIRTLKTLAADPNNRVWIISGRDQAFLDEWMGHISELGLSAEHGSFMRQPKSDEWENLTAQTDMSWQQEVMQVFQHYTERTHGSFIERKKIALTWHYRRADPEYGAFQARECQKFLKNTVEKKYDVEVMTGKANLEVRPRFVNKGEIAKRLVAEYGEGPDQQPEFVLCLGDDFTDEDMFRALNQSNLPKDNVFACTVGASSKQTLASWHLLEPSDVISSVALLNGSADAGNVGAVAVVDGAVPESRL